MADNNPLSLLSNLGGQVVSAAQNIPTAIQQAVTPTVQAASQIPQEVAGAAAKGAQIVSDTVYGAGKAAEPIINQLTHNPAIAAAIPPIAAVQAAVAVKEQAPAALKALSSIPNLTEVFSQPVPTSAVQQQLPQQSVQPTDTTPPVYAIRSDVPAVAMEASLSLGDALINIPSTLTFGVIPEYRPGHELLERFGQTSEGRDYGAYSDYSSYVFKKITGDTPQQYEAWKQTTDFANMSDVDRIIYGAKEVLASPEKAGQSFIQGVGLAVLGGGISKVATLGGQAPGLITKAAQFLDKPSVNKALFGLYTGAGVYQSAGGFDISDKGITPKVGVPQFESNIGSFGSNLFLMGLGARLPESTARSSAFISKAGEGGSAGPRLMDNEAAVLGSGGRIIKGSTLEEIKSINPDTYKYGGRPGYLMDTETATGKNLFKGFDKARTVDVSKIQSPIERTKGYELYSPIKPTTTKVSPSFKIPSSLDVISKPSSSSSQVLQMRKPLETISLGGGMSGERVILREVEGTRQKTIQKSEYEKRAEKIMENVREQEKLREMDRERSEKEREKERIKQGKEKEKEKNKTRQNEIINEREREKERVKEREIINEREREKERFKEREIVNIKTDEIIKGKEKVDEKVDEIITGRGITIPLVGLPSISLGGGTSAPIVKGRKRKLHTEIFTLGKLVIPTGKVNVGYKADMRPLTTKQPAQRPVVKQSPLKIKAPTQQVRYNKPQQKQSTRLHINVPTQPVRQVKARVVSTPRNYIPMMPQINPIRTNNNVPMNYIPLNNLTGSKGKKKNNSTNLRSALF